MKEKNPMQQKVKVLVKLYDSGCTTERELQSLKMEAILQIPGITVNDMNMILEIQKYSKAGKLYSYLGGETDEPKCSQ